MRPTEERVDDLLEQIRDLKARAQKNLEKKDKLVEVLVKLLKKN